MIKRSKVFLPRWHRWFIMPVLLLAWGVVTYVAFFSPERDEVGPFVWIITTLLLGLVGVVMWLMSSGKLPAYIIEEEIKD